MGTERTIRAIRVMLLGLACAAFAACTNSPADPDRSPGPVEGELVSTADALPPEFPQDHPRPGSPTVLYSAVSQVGSVVYFSTSMPHDEIVRALLEQLPADGWTVFGCRTVPGEEPVSFIVASKGRRVASSVVGFSAEQAARINGARYSYLVSVANDAPEPIEQDISC
ncbi:MAG TPA: hypothetical protein VGB52_15400 [Actinomycetota bacterium]